MKEPGFTFNIKEESLIGNVPFAAKRIVAIGTAERGPIAVSNGRKLLEAKDIVPYADYSSIEEVFGRYDEMTGQSELRLMRGVDLLCNGGANYIYPIRICDGNESGGTLRLRKNENVVGAYALEIGSYDTGSYSKDIQIRIRDSDGSPFEMQEIFYPDGTSTGFTLKYYPTTGSVQRIPPGGTLALLTGSTWTTVEVAQLVDPLDGVTPVEEGGTPDWANASSCIVHYGNRNAGYGWEHTVDPKLVANLSTGSTLDCAIYCDTGAPWGHNLIFADDATDTSQSDAPCVKGKAIRVRYFYDAKDLEVKWNDKSEIFKGLNSANNWIATINSGSTLIKAYSDTGTASKVVIMDSGTSTMPLNMDWTNLGAGNDGRNVSLSDYRAAYEIIEEENWDYLVLPGCSDPAVHNMIKSKLNTDWINNFEHVARLGHDTGVTIGEVIGWADGLRDKLIDLVSAGSDGIKHTNRYTDKVETGSAAYAACIVAGNESKHSISTDLLSVYLDGVEGLFGEWSKAERERLLDFGVKSIK
ncbi:MAG: hypothetical protein DRG33_06795, partial [Deltaproteobacteria bacterium]